MRIETKAIHAGLHTQEATSDVVPPIHKSTIFEHSVKGYHEGDLAYTRADNPNRKQLEHLIATLEEGETCAAFSSGVAAAAAVLMSLQPGDHLLIPDDIYAGNRQLINEVMVPWGLKADYVSMTNLGNVKNACQKATKLIWVESPSNPMLNITDIAAICNFAQEQDILVCVDNTWPSPINQLPLKLGADLVLHSTTKYFSGHSDILGGALIGKEKNGIMQKIKELQVTMGAVPSPEDCWMLSRSIRTLPYRMRAHNENAMKVAHFLQNHSTVKKVLYPGLSSHKGYKVAKRQMTGFGGMISFLINGNAESALEIVARAKLIGRATSLGGVESTWEHRQSSEGEHSAAPDNLIRISVGLEHPEDIIADLKQAL